MGKQRAQISNDAVSKQADSSSASKVQRPLSGLPENNLFEDFERPRISSLNRLGIQTKLSIGPANDKYEQEADRVAEEVMGYRITHVDAPANDSGVPDVQLYKHSDTVQASSHSLNNQIESATGGEPLDNSTRTFYENKLGYDFSDVRIHRGSRAQALNQELGSLAFAYGNNVWLSPSISAKPSFVLTHELVHVVQQSSPSNTKGEVANDTCSINLVQQHKVQRFAPYWDLPGRDTGVDIHDGALTDISRQTNMFIEAPVPNKGGSYRNGRADLYKASTTVGVYAKGHHDFGRLNKPLGLMGRQGFRHRRDAAPWLLGNRVMRNQNLTRIANAPEYITVGELKPSHGTLQALGGAEQVADYQKGFQMAAREVNDFQNSRNEPEWNLRNVSIFNEHALNNAIPSIYQERNMSGQKTSTITLKHSGREVSRNLRTQGRFVLKPDPRNRGVLNYVWVPASVNVARIPANLRRLGREITARVLNPLRESPVRQRSRRRAARFVAPSITKPIVQQRAKPQIQLLQTDSFDANRHRQWQRDREQLHDQYRAIDNTPAAQSAEHASLVLEAHRAIETKAHVNAPNPSASTVEAGQTIDRIKFWTSARAAPIGRFRRVFGRVFINVANAYDRMKERFRDRLNARRHHGVSGLAGAAMKAIFNVLKIAARVVVEQTLSVLQNSLVRGVRRKVEQLIGGDNIDEMQEKLQEIEDLRLELEQQAIQTAEQLVDNTIGPYLETIEELEDIRGIVSNIARIVNLVRWGARALACGAPPGLGCLWILAQAVLEEFAAMVVESCWFQEKIKPWVLRLQYIRQLPMRLARQIITYMRSILPVSLQDVFADVEVPEVNASEVNCDSLDSGGTPDQSQIALMELQERLGEERFQAFLRMSRRAGTPSDTPLTVERARQIAEAIEQSGASASEMQLYGLLYERRPNSVPVGLREFLDNANQNQAALQQDAESLGEDDNIGGGGSEVDVEDGANSDGSGNTDVNVITGTGTPSVQRHERAAEQIAWDADVLDGVGRGNFRGTRVTLRVRLMHRTASSAIDGRVLSFDISGVRARVIRREYLPSSQNRQAMRVYIRTNRLQTFNVRLSSGQTIPVQIFAGGTFVHEFPL